ncbi:MAG: hypothetical protein M3271_09080 [Actinomycetota bacterium]|nr:hypothetical protein [Actinomycetota bacterium]
MRTKIHMFLVVALAMTVMGPAAGHDATWEDQDQAEAPEREMEIRSVTQRHRSGTLDHTSSRAHFISFVIETFEDFENSRLDYFETEHWALMIGFNLDERGDLDRILYVDAEPDASDGYTLYGVMTGGRQRFDPDDEGRWVPMRRVLGYVRVERPSADAVSVEFPESTLKRGGVDTFRWQVRTVWRDKEGSEECQCTANSFDYAPSRGTHRGHT